MSKFEPEMGQMIFGQPSHRFAVPDIWDAALCYIREDLNRVMWNREQREYSSLFDNSGNRFECSAFKVEAYSWEDECQPFNFKWRKIEISWYKYLGRGMSSNVLLTPDLAAEMLEDCLLAIRALDAVDDDAA